MNSKPLGDRYALSRIMEEMDLLNYCGNGWDTTEYGARFSTWHKGVFDSDAWHPELVDEIINYLNNKR